MAELPGIEINATQAAGNLTTEITITRWRWWNIKKVIGLIVIKFGIWIIGTDSVINKEH